MRTALRLREYESVLSAEEIYSLVALTAFYSRFYNQCSKAFIKLQSSAGLREAKALFDEGILSADEFKDQKAALLGLNRTATAAAPAASF